MDRVVATVLIPIETQEGYPKGEEGIHWTPERALIGRSIWN
jgi:hypothetical protein